MSATVIPFPDTDQITREELEVCAAILQGGSLMLDDLEAQRSPDADPELRDALLDHADMLLDLAQDDATTREELEAALAEFDRLDHLVCAKTTRAGMRRTAGDATVAQVERALQFAGAMAITSHMAHISYDEDGQPMCEYPLDRGMMRRFLRAVGDGFEWADANVPDAGPFRGELLDVLRLATLDGPATATTMRDAMHRLFLLWSDRELVAKGACRMARDRMVNGRGHDLEARREAFEVGVGAAIASSILQAAHPRDADTTLASTNPAEWLDVLEAATV